jgi:hypothetical protein
MRLLFVVSCAVLLHLVCSSVTVEGSDRVRRGADDEGFSLKKVKDGVKSFGNKVSGVAVQGYEELKNLFSSKRKVGDYRINQLDVRFGEEETTTVEEETTTEFDVETTAEERNEVRKKRAAAESIPGEMSHDFVVDLDELTRHIVQSSTKSKRTETRRGD